MSYKIMHKFYH